MNDRGAMEIANGAGGGPSAGTQDSRKPARPAGHDDSDVAAKHAWGLYAQGNWQEAVREIRAGLQRFPDSLDLLFVEGLSLKRLDRQSEALAAFREALVRVDRVGDKTRAAMLRRLLVGHINMLEKGGWNLEPETWVRV